MFSISSQPELLTIVVKHTFQLIERIKQSRHLSPPIIVEEKPKEVLKVKKNEEQPQKATYAKVVVLLPLSRKLH